MITCRRLLTVALVVFCLGFMSLPSQAAGSLVGWGGIVFGTDVSSGIVQVEAGQGHYLALRSNGSIAAWGLNMMGECQVPLPNSGYTAISVGSNNVALRSDHSIAAWGMNDYGQCDVPAPNTNFIAASAGPDAHVLGLKADNSIVSWGNNGSYQCDIPAPNADFMAVAAGYNFSAALKINGSVTMWGSSAYNVSMVPSPNEGFTQIAAGNNHMVGLKNDGTVVCWGSNDQGQSTVPTPNSGFVAIAAGSYTSMAMRADGSIVVWGNNTSGEWNVPAPNEGYTAMAGGNGVMMAVKGGAVVTWGADLGLANLPGPLPDFISVSASFNHVIGVKSDGTLAAYGSNDFGKCEIPFLNEGFIAVDAGFNHNVALRADGAVFAWGDTSMGQVYPPHIMKPCIAVSAGYSHSLALTEDGEVIAWGGEVVGAAAIIEPIPPILDVPEPNTGFIAISAGFDHSLALREDGSVAAWGDNTFGQCDVPIPNTGFIAVSAGRYFSLGLKADGTIVAWGEPAVGSEPVPNEGFVAIDAGQANAVALRADGSTVSWYMSKARLDKALFGTRPPVTYYDPAPNTDFIAIAASGEFNVGIRAVSRFKPDAKIRRLGESAYQGEDVYNNSGLNQTVTTVTPSTTLVTYYVQIQNDGTVNDDLVVTAPPAPGGWTVRYYTGAGTNVTAAVTNPAMGWATGILSPWASSFLRVTMQAATGTAPGSVCSIPITVWSTTGDLTADTVKAVTATRCTQPDIKIRNAGEINYLGDNTYSLDGAGQTKSQILVPGAAATFYVNLQNDGNVADYFVLTGTAAPYGWKVKIYDIYGVDITSQVLDQTTGWTTRWISPQGSTYIRVLIQPGTNTPPVTNFPLLLTLRSQVDTATADAVKALVAARRCTPDAKVRHSGDAYYLGDEVYNTNGYAQTRTYVLPDTTPVSYFLQVQNDGNVEDTLRVTGPAGRDGWTVKYYAPGGVLVTSLVTDPAVGWTTGSLAPQAYSYLRVEVTPGTGVLPGAVFPLALAVQSVTEPVRTDVAIATSVMGLPQPDAKIRLAGDNLYLGDNVYSVNGENQVRQTTLTIASPVTFYVQIQNDGNTADSMLVSGPASSGGWTIRYYDSGATEVTAQVTNPATKWSTGLLDPQKYAYLRVVITPGGSVLTGSVFEAVINAKSATSALQQDSVKAVVIR